MSRLITPSLIGSIDWLKSCPSSWKAKAALDLKNQLARVWSEPGPSLKLGIDFENAVYEHAVLTTKKGSEHFQWFVNECVNGQFQRKTKQLMTIDGEEYCLYGKLDVWFPNIIKDIKTTSNFKGPEYYLKSFQHKMYCFNEGIDDFRYIVAEFDSKQKLIAHHAIDYHCEDRGALATEVIDTIKEAVKFLKSNTQLFELYTTKFSLY